MTTQELTDCQKGQLIAKAWANPDFEALLSTNPGHTVKTQFGIDFSGTIEIPERPNGLNVELLDQLQKGTGDYASIGLCCCTVPA